MRSNSSDKKESGKRIPFLFYRELLPITLNYRKYKNEVILGFYDYLTIPEKALFYREIQTFCISDVLPYISVKMRLSKNAPKCGKNLWVKIDLVFLHSQNCISAIQALV